MSRRRRANANLTRMAQAPIAPSPLRLPDHGSGQQRLRCAYRPCATHFKRRSRRIGFQNHLAAAGIGRAESVCVWALDLCRTSEWSASDANSCGGVASWRTSLSMRVVCARSSPQCGCRPAPLGHVPWLPPPPPPQQNNKKERWAEAGDHGRDQCSERCEQIRSRRALLLRARGCLGLNFQRVWSTMMGGSMSRDMSMARRSLASGACRQ